MTPRIQQISVICFVLLIASSSSRSQDSSRENPSQPLATMAPSNLNVSVDVLSNRHVISSYVYGGAYPRDAPTITDSGMTVVRWGGNATSRYNWQAGTYNAANDWYFARLWLHRNRRQRFRQVHSETSKRRAAIR